MTKKTSRPSAGNATIARVLRAFIDQNGDTHFMIGNDERNVVVSLDDFNSDGNKAFQRIGRAGFAVLTTERKNKLKREIEDWRDFEEAYVAVSPGWLPNNDYVHPDGSHTVYDEEYAPPIVAFETDARWSTGGKILKWREEMGKIFKDEPIAVFLFCYGLVGPLLKFLDKNIQNPFVEIISGPESGKSTLAAAVASMYGSNPDSELGLGRNWDGTAHSYYRTRRIANDGFLFMDDSSKMDDALKKDGALAYMQSTSDERKRYTEDDRIKPVRTALLSTGNKPFHELMTGPYELKEAAQSRVISIKMDRPILNTAPSGYDSTRAAIEAVKSIIDKHHGGVGRRFIEKISDYCKEDEPAFRKRVAALMKEFEDYVVGSVLGESRLLQAFCAAYAAGKLGLEWRLLPVGFEDLDEALEEVFEMASRARRQDHPIDPYRQALLVIRNNKDRIFEIGPDLEQQLRDADDNVFGVKDTSDAQTITFYLHGSMLKDLLGDSSGEVIRYLREKEYLKVDRSGKITRKPPRNTKLEKRVYMLVLPRKRRTR
nr:DUF927 domain-containing protein [uncultured Cohaesibacter sp.]